MNFQKIKEVVFPYGDRWFYIPALLWILATSVFYIAFPTLPLASGERYSEIMGVVFDPNIPLIELAGFLHGAAFNLTRVFILYLIASAIFDGIEDYKVGRRKRGYL
jgi:hypothetical protein